MRPRISVLVPTRGRPDLAATCVRALLAQHHPSFEVVVCDQSPDGATARALQEADDGSHRLRRIAVDGVGRSRALNAGLPHTRGDWVVFTDDDCPPSTRDGSTATSSTPTSPSRGPSSRAWGGSTSA